MCAKPYSSGLLVTEAQRAALRQEALTLPAWDLEARQIPLLESLLNGAFAPLEGYMDRQVAAGVLDAMRLPDGSFWPIPIHLDVSLSFADGLTLQDRVVLRHPEGMALAVLTISDMWQTDAQSESLLQVASAISDDTGATCHPMWLGGRIEGLELPPHHSFREFHQSPEHMAMQSSGARLLAIPHRGLLFPEEVAAISALAREHDAGVLVLQENLSALGGDYPDWSLAEIRCVREALRHVDGVEVLFHIHAPFHGDPLRVELLGAVMARNFHCSHVAIRLEDALHVAGATPAGLDIQAVRIPAHRTEWDERALFEKVRRGEALPEDCLFPETLVELRRSFPPPCEQGFAVFFTGLSGSGKSTLANALTARLLEIGGRPVTLLDGDIVRKNLSSELTFSREHRDLNIQRIGFVASEIVKNHGVAVCAPIAPYRQARRQARKAIEWYGAFIEVHVSTPLEVCEQRDRKGLYARARKGLVKGFTGIDDPYETPENAELVLDTSQWSVDDAVEQVLQYLAGRGFLGKSG